MSCKIKKYTIRLLFALLIASLLTGVLTGSLFVKNEVYADGYTYATTYEQAPDEYIDSWIIIPNDGYKVPLGSISYATGKIWSGYFKLNTKLHFDFSIQDDEEKEYRFFFGGGGWVNSYNVILNYKTDKVNLKSEQNKKTCDAKEFNLELGKIYQAEVSLISIYQNDTPVGERVKVIISDGTDTVSTEYDFFGAELSGYAQGSGHNNTSLNSFGYADANKSATSVLKLYACDQIKDNTDGRYVYATTFENAQQHNIEEYFDLNGAGIALNNGQNESSWFVYYSKYVKNTTLNFKVNISEPEQVTEKAYLIYFGGGTMWNSYSLALDYGKQTVYLQNCYTPSGSSTVVMTSPAIAFPLEYGKTYSVSICLIEINDKEGNAVGDSVKVAVTNGENTFEVSSDFFGGARCGYAQGATDKKALGRFGFFSPNPKTEAFFKPYDYNRDYVLTIVTEKKNVLIELQYGDEYDFTSYVEEREMYELSHFSARIDGVQTEINPKGVWETDITILTGKLYSATLYPEYRATEYDIIYSISNATLPQGTQNKVTVENPVKLPTELNLDNGYVFFGWYIDSALTQKVEKVECSGKNVTVYAKVLEGYTLMLEMPSGNEKIPVEKNATFDLTTITEKGYEISGWTEFDGTNYNSIGGFSVSATDNKILKPIANKIDYTITYNLDGGTNATENKTTYTIDDEFVFATPEKAGYLFVKFVDQEGKQVFGIEKGTIGNLTLIAVFEKDEFADKTSIFASNSAQDVPLFTIPQTATYTVAITRDGHPLTIQNGKATFDKVGNYTAVYTITLCGGKTVDKIVTVESKKLTITLDEDYQAKYKRGTYLPLIDATCEKESAVIKVKVLKDGKEIEFEDFGLTLEKGKYTVIYTVENEIADELTVNFTVTDNTGLIVGASLGSVTIAGLAVTAILIIKKRRVL